MTFPDRSSAGTGMSYMGVLIAHNGMPRMILLSHKELPMTGAKLVHVSLLEHAPGRLSKKSSGRPMQKLSSGKARRVQLRMMLMHYRKPSNARVGFGAC